MFLPGDLEADVGLHVSQGREPIGKVADQTQVLGEPVVGLEDLDVQLITDVVFLHLGISGRGADQDHVVGKRLSLIYLLEVLQDRLVVAASEEVLQISIFCQIVLDDLTCNSIEAFR